MSNLGQPVVEHSLIGAALDQNVLETGVGESTEELGSGDFIQKLPEHHGSTAGDNGHASGGNCD